MFGARPQASARVGVVSNLLCFAQMLDAALDVQAGLLLLSLLGVTYCVLDVLYKRRSVMRLFPIMDSFLRLADRLFEVLTGGKHDLRRRKQCESKTQQSNCQSSSHHHNVLPFAKPSVNDITDAVFI